nr:MAG TPA: hypothetical protein [Caudoviricetes sp.]
MKQYTIDLRTDTYEMTRRVVKFIDWLWEYDVEHELHQLGGHVLRFELFLEPGGIDVVNEALDQIVWFDAITGVHNE